MENGIVRCIYNEESYSENRKLQIYDTTLRDGEQTLGVAFNRYKKLEIAQKLEEVGVPYIECGMPVSSEEDAKAFTLILNSVKNSEIYALARSRKSDIDKCLDLGIKNITCELPISDLKMKAYEVTREETIERLQTAVSYAKSQGMHVGFFGIDATRTDEKFLKKIYTIARDAGADEVTVVDTIGIASPYAIANMVGKLRSWLGPDIRISCHCHNDMATGTLSSIEAFKAGADIVHVTVNGLGERCGNVDLATVAVAAKVLYDIDSTIDYSKLVELSALVSRLSGVPVPGNFPVVGKNVFVRESGLTVQQMVNYPPSVEPFAPEWVGAKRDVSLGKNSGKASIDFALDKHGLKLDDGKKPALLQAVKEKGVEKGTSLTDAEFIEAYNKIAR